MASDKDYIAIIDAMITPIVERRLGPQGHDEIAQKLKDAVRIIGVMVNDSGLDIFRIAEEAARDPSARNWGMRMSILNSAWNGIGHWGA